MKVSPRSPRRGVERRSRGEEEEEDEEEEEARAAVAERTFYRRTPPARLSLFVSNL